MKYVVMCRVFGGVTGTREAPLKGKDGVQFFDTKESAEAVAKQMRDQMGRGSQTCFFHYWAEPSHLGHSSE